MIVVKLLGATCSAAILSGFAAPAWAQSTAPQTAAGEKQTVSPARDDSAADIVVTAQKREERLKDVPASVVVLGGAALQEQGADTLEDYVARVPGLAMAAKNVGQQQLTIRGLSTGTGYASTVATYIDDAPVGASNGDGTGGLITPEIDSIDLARIEVLRGPQGTLYGASNIGGLVKYVTVSPDLTKIEAAADITGVTAAHGEEGYAVRGRVSVPIVSDKLSVLASGYIRHDPGFVDDDVQDRRNLDGLDAKGFRLALRAEPIENLSINLAAIGSDKSTDGFTQIDADGVTLEPLYGNYIQQRARNSTYQTTRVRLYYATIGYDMGWAKISSTTSYNKVHHRSSEDNTALFVYYFPDGFGQANPGYTGNYLIDQNKLTEELRLSGSVGNMLEWLVGGYYTREHSSTGVGFNTIDAITGESQDLGFVLLNTTTIGRYRELAGFAQATVHLSPEFDITGGIRYAHNTQHATATSSGILAGGTPAPTVTEASDSATTFTVAPQYKVNPDVTVYARVATGYRPGGANGATAPKPTYAPDRVTNYETGIKGSLDNGRLTFDIDAFYVEWTGIQLQVTNAGLSYTDNAGKASSRGMEANINYRLLPGWSLGAAASYIDAHLDEDLPAGNLVGHNGDSLPYSAKWKLAAQTNYEQDIGNDMSAFIGGSLYYVSSNEAGFVTSSAAVRTQLPGYVTVDGRLGISRGPFTLSLLGKNLFDKRGYNGAAPLNSALTDGPVVLNIIQPRTLAVDLRFNY